MANPCYTLGMRPDDGGRRSTLRFADSDLTCERKPTRRTTQGAEGLLVLCEERQNSRIEVTKTGRAAEWPSGNFGPRLPPHPRTTLGISAW